MLHAFSVPVGTYWFLKYVFYRRFIRFFPSSWNLGVFLCVSGIISGMRRALSKYRLKVFSNEMNFSILALNFFLLACFLLLGSCV